MGAERFAGAALTPVLQEPVHVDVGEQRARDAALRRAARVALAADHAPGSVGVTLLDRCLEPHLDEAQDVAIHDTPGHRLEEVRVRNRIEVARQVGVYDIGVAPDDMPVHFLDCVDRPTTGR